MTVDNFIWLLPVFVSIGFYVYSQRKKPISPLPSIDSIMLQLESKDKIILDLVEELSQLKNKVIEQEIELAKMQIQLEHFVGHHSIPENEIAHNTVKHKILVVAPKSDLPLYHELNNIFNSGIEYTVIDGDDVTKSKILAELERENYSILHIMAHADEKGVLLSREDASIGFWARLSKFHNFELVFLNACETLAIADVIEASGIDYIIATRKKIENTDAIQFSTNIYYYIGQGFSIEKSYELSRLTLNEQAYNLVTLQGTKA